MHETETKREIDKSTVRAGEHADFNFFLSVMDKMMQKIDKKFNKDVEDLNTLSTNLVKLTYRTF